MVTWLLSSSICYPFKCFVDFLNPNIDSYKLISTVWIKLSPSLAHFFVGISITFIYKSEGAPIYGSSPKFNTFKILPSGKPFGITTSTYYIFFMILFPWHFGHSAVGYFPHPIQLRHVSSKNIFWPHPVFTYRTPKPFPPHFGQLFNDLALSAPVPLQWSHATSLRYLVLIVFPV